MVARAQLVMASSATSGKIMRVSSNAEALVCTVGRIQGVSRVSRHPPFCLGALFEKNIF